MDYKDLIDLYYYGGDCDDTEIEKEVLSLIENTDSYEVLHAFATKHNYDDGLDIPKMIIENPNCDLATALTVFYDIEANDYLMYGKESDIYAKETYELFKNIRKRVYEGQYKRSGKIAFEVPLNKLQIFRLKKNGLKTKDYVFIENITDDLNQEE